MKSIGIAETQGQFYNYERDVIQNQSRKMIDKL